MTVYLIFKTKIFMQKKKLKKNMPNYQTITNL